MFKYLKNLFTREKDQKRLELEIMLIAQDAGECCRQNMIDLVEANCNYEFSKHDIMGMICDMLEDGRLLTDGDYIFDPIAKPNTAKRVRNGGKVI